MTPSAIAAEIGFEPSENEGHGGGAGDGSTESQGLYDTLRATQAEIGLARLRMGAALVALEDTGEWRGRTSKVTFRGFMSDEGIEPKAAYQYMQVARELVIRMDLSETQLKQISCASMRTLTYAGRVANDDNLDQVLAIVETLPRPEAIEALLELAPEHQEELPPEALRDGSAAEFVQRFGKARLPPLSRSVTKILDQLGDLTMDQKAELYRVLRAGPVPAQSRAQSRSPS